MLRASEKSNARASKRQNPNLHETQAVCQWDDKGHVVDEVALASLFELLHHSVEQNVQPARRQFWCFEANIKIRKEKKKEGKEGKKYNIKTTTFLLHHSLVAPRDMRNRILHKEVCNVAITASQSNASVRESVTVVDLDFRLKSLQNLKCT